MTSKASEDELVKVSTDGKTDSYRESLRLTLPAATDFVEAFYIALGDSRATLENYYTPKKEATDGNATPDIQWNGNQYSDAASFKKMFQDDMPKMVFFDVHAVDAQVLNPKWDPDAKVKAERNISIMVIVNGHVRLEDRKT